MSIIKGGTLVPLVFASLRTTCFLCGKQLGGKLPGFLPDFQPLRGEAGFDLGGGWMMSQDVIGQFWVDQGGVEEIRPLDPRISVTLLIPVSGAYQSYPNLVLA